MHSQELPQSEKGMRKAGSLKKKNRRKKRRLTPNVESEKRICVEWEETRKEEPHPYSIDWGPRSTARGRSGKKKEGVDPHRGKRGESQRGSKIKPPRKMVPIRVQKKRKLAIVNKRGGGYVERKGNTSGLGTMGRLKCAKDFSNQRLLEGGVPSARKTLLGHRWGKEKDQNKKKKNEETLTNAG